MTEKDNPQKRFRSHLRSIPSDKATSYEIKVSAWINHCQEVAVNQSDSLFDEFIETVDEKFNENIDKASNNQDNVIALGDLKEFRENADKLKLHFGDQINHGFDLFKRKSLATYLREPNPDDKVWSLIDNDELEENIAIKTIAHESNIEFSEEIWQLEKRFSSINGGEPVTEHNNPISPLQFCTALRSALGLVNLHAPGKLTAYKSFASLVYKYLEPLYSTTNDFFISEGILPSLRFEQGLTESTYDVKKSIEENPYLQSQTEKDGENTEGDAIYNDSPMQDGDQIQLVYAIRQLLQQRNQYNEPNPPGSPSEPPVVSEMAELQYQPNSNTSSQPPILFINQQIIDAVDAVQSANTTALVDNTDTPNIDPISIANTSRQLASELTKQSEDGKIDPKDMYTIDLVGILFEYILTDENLPDRVKAVLSHLHTPFLKLAFIDTQFFEKPEHPARLLLDSLAEAGANWVNQDGTDQYNMYDEITKVVTHVLENFKNDVRLFAESLFEFNRLKNKLSHKHQLKERNTVERVQGQERLRLAKTRAKKEIESRTKGIKLPGAVIQLLKPWYTYLTLLQLRDSENESLWRQALRIVDELCYFFDFSNDADRSELEPRFNGILTAIKTGFTTLSYDQTKTKKILVDLTALKIATVKMYVKTQENSQNQIEDSSQPAVEEEKKPLPIKEPEPLVQEEEEPSEEELKVINYLKLIEPGTWFEIDDNQRLKVSGFSSKLLKYMLVDSTSQKVIMISRLELARKIIAGNAKIVAGSTKPLFERALERIFQHLDQQAKSFT